MTKCEWLEQEIASLEELIKQKEGVTFSNTIRLRVLEKMYATAKEEEKK